MINNIFTLTIVQQRFENNALNMHKIDFDMNKLAPS